MTKEKSPATQAIRVLRAQNAEFSIHAYRYEDKGGTSVASQELNVNEYNVIKTLVMEDEEGAAFLVLMHGDKKVSTKGLARFLGVKSVTSCEPDKAYNLTGYFVGGISPFGTKRKLRVYIESTILDLETIYINAGKRGLLLAMKPNYLSDILKPIPVQVAIS